MKGYVYLLQEQDFSGNPTGLYKIGKTTQDSIEARARQYRAGNARPVVEHYSVAVSDCQKTETALHQEYKRYRLKAGGGDEWFRLDDRLVADVIQNMRSYGHGRQKVSPLRKGVPAAMPRQAPYSDNSFPLWVVAGLAGALILFVRPGSADIKVGGRYELQQDPYIDCPLSKQPCNGGNVWSDDYKVIATKRNGSRFTVTGKPSDPDYIEVKFDDGLTGWIWKKSVKPAK